MHLILPGTTTAVLLLLAGWLAQVPGSAQAATAITGEPRIAFSPQAPRWLRAVGRLQVPIQRESGGEIHYFLEDCSATLVTREGRETADIIVTAWHCLDGYSDISRDIVFTPLTAADSQGGITARLLVSGGSMQADWAILRLQRPVTALEGRALYLLPAAADRGTRLAMAGYSKDDGLGQGGAQLTYDPACWITADSPAGVDTDCRAYKGASGGAVAQATSAGDMAYCGVISAGDSGTLSRYVPLARFRRQLERQLH